MSDLHSASAAYLLAVCLSALAGGLFVVALAWLSSRIIPSRFRPAATPQDEHIQILVLGDIGRSPRMQYHAISVARHGLKVDLVGYKGNPNVKLYPLAPQPEWLAWGTLPFFLHIPCKVLHQFWTLTHTLLYATPAPRWIIVQNPPSIPTFHVALLASWLRGSRVLVDWHNYGHTILAQNRLMKPLVPVYRFYEFTLGRLLPTANLAVTDAMARQLRPGGRHALRSPVHTLHDRPADTFRPILSATERLAFLSRLAETQRQARDIVDGAVRLVASSTSWTADEDFGLLLDALVEYANTPAGEDRASRTPILAIITGKGPQRNSYLERIKQLQDAKRLPGITILSAWLSNRDYASLLACADLGISLHKSSSGVDLPMKVVDMFGAGLPVAAYAGFESIGELVREGENGCGFETAAELAGILKRLLSREGAEELARLKRGAVEEGSLGWDQEWDRVVAKLIDIT